MQAHLREWGFGSPNTRLHAISHPLRMPHGCWSPTGVAPRSSAASTSPPPHLLCLLGRSVHSKRASGMHKGRWAGVRPASAALLAGETRCLGRVWRAVAGAIPLDFLLAHRRSMLLPSCLDCKGA